MFRVLYHIDGTDEIFNLHLTDDHPTKEAVLEEIKLGMNMEEDEPAVEDMVFVYDVSDMDEKLIQGYLWAHNEACTELITDQDFILLREWLLTTGTK